MVRKKESILVILSDNQILSFRHGKSEYSENNKKTLSDFSKIIKQDTDFKYLVPLSENNCFMLRSLIAEILYISVEPDGGNIFFITDKAGESFLRNMLYDFHTEATDLKTNLLKYQKEKIHVITTGRIPPISENDITVFFRTSENCSEPFHAKRAICIVTLRDLHKNSNKYIDFVQSFENRGWSRLPSINITFEQSQDENSHIKINIQETRHNGISNFYQSANLAGFCTDSLKEYVQGFAFFYMAATIPLKWYDYYKPDDPKNEEFISSMLPSQSASRIPGIGVQQSVILQAMCASLEQELQDENPKYKKITSVIREIVTSGGTAIVLMPNKLVSDAFSWSLFEGKMARGIHSEDVTVTYPESFFIESLFEERKFDAAIIPFVPSSEIILASQNLAKKLNFILYPFERKLLYHTLSEANMPQSGQWYIQSTTQKFALVDDSDNSRSIANFSLNVSNIKEYAYNRFLTYLAKGDPKEGDSHSRYEGEVDKRHFTFTATDGLEYNVNGWESVILFNEQETAFFRKYVWITPGAVEKKDKVFIVPHQVRYAQFEKELAENLQENITNLQQLIDYITEWKSALITVRKSYNYAQIHRKLVAANLVRDYVTIRHWFSDLLDDPRDSAISSIIDSKSNIGPKYSEDIKKFGEAFGNETLIAHHEFIHYSMKAIRANNQHMGKTTMNKILMTIEDPEMRKQCIFFEVKKIKVKE